MKTSIASHRIASHHIVVNACLATLSSLAVVGGVNSAQAATVQFTDLASFQANTTGLTNINFEGLAPAGNFVNYPTGLTAGGVNFTAGNSLFVIDPALLPSFYDWGSGAILSAQGGTGTIITAILPSGVTAVGSDIMSFSNYASPFTINLSTGETFNINSLNYPNRQFIGFTSDVAIASLSFQATAGRTQIDNFRFGTAANATTAVPEPFTIIGTLVGGTAALRMRKKLKAAGK